MRIKDKNTIINNNYIFRYMLMIFGIFLCAIGINAFLTPS